MGGSSYVHVCQRGHDGLAVVKYLSIFTPVWAVPIQYLYELWLRQFDK